MLVEAVQAVEKPGIVCIATRKASEELAGELREAGVAAEAYHAGFGSKRRGELQDAFMDDEIETIVATTAFGMGIDKPNVRFVFHAGLSDSVDSYYQEVGRAGRDGEPAAACVFYRPEDQAIRRFFAGGGPEEREEYERSRLEMMRSYAEHTGCRRDFVLSYFGEEHEPRAATATTAMPAWSNPKPTSSAPSRSAPPPPTPSGARAKSSATKTTA